MRILLIFLSLCALLLLLAHRPAAPLPDSEQLIIRLRWCRSYPAEKWENIQMGIAWTLSHLGANLPQSTIYQVLQSTEESDVVELRLDRAGFPAPAQAALVTVLDSLKKTGEYQRFCSIDLGRFVVLTVHAPRHYYRIVGMPARLRDFKRLHGLDQADHLRFPVIRSSIAKGNRMVAFRMGKYPTEWAFLATEGEGRLEMGNFKATEHEVFDIMPNGQLRFGIYDRDGQLENATPSHLSEAGKPGNCMWCHETMLQPLYSYTHNVPGQLTAEAFVDTIQSLQIELRKFQVGLHSDIRFERTYDHTSHELLYICFMEPNAERVAAEWNLPLAEAQRRLQGLPTHQNYEFAWMGQLYDRRDIDRLAPCQPARVPDYVREPSEFEPDFFVKKRELWAN